MFTRGQTQVLSVATLAPLSEIQKLDGIDLEETKRYIHHYNFPSYSVGETRPQEARADVKSVTVHLQNVHLFLYFRQRTSSHMLSELYQKFFLQTVQLLKAVSAVLHLLLWQQAFLLKPLLQVSLAVL